MRRKFAMPFAPNSGYRSVELNKAIGGSVTSQHTLGEAVDIELPGVSNYDLAVWIAANLYFDQLILEDYTPGKPNSGWVHVSLKAFDNRTNVLTYTKGRYITGLMS